MSFSTGRQASRTGKPEKMFRTRVNPSAETRDLLRAISNGLLLAFETDAVAYPSDGIVGGGGRTL